MVKIRLARMGRRKLSIYTVVAADSRMPRDGRFLQKLGQYNPHQEPSLKVDAPSVKAWLDQGAVLSETVASLLKKNNIELA